MNIIALLIFKFKLKLASLWIADLDKLMRHPGFHSLYRQNHGFNLTVYLFIIDDGMPFMAVAAEDKEKESMAVYTCIH